MVYQCRAQQLAPRFDLVTPGSALAIDCEGVELPSNVGAAKKGCGRVSIVNEREEVVYDTFVHYSRHIEHRPPPQHLKLGVKYKDILPRNGAQHIDKVTRTVTNLLDRSGIIVGHAIENDLRMLSGVPWDRYETHDTQQQAFWQTDSKALNVLASAVRGRQLQAPEHSSVDDAQATMALFLGHRDRPALANFYDSGIGSGSDFAGVANKTPSLWSGETAPSSPKLNEAAMRALEAHRASISRWVAPGHVVAIPFIKELTKGRKFDTLTSTCY